jgi:hypothetical protein
VAKDCFIQHGVERLGEPPESRPRRSRNKGLSARREHESRAGISASAFRLQGGRAFGGMLRRWRGGPSTCSMRHK